jgi:hypothetical protein
MKNSVLLTIASLLSILFGTFHLTDDIIRGWLSGTATNLAAVPVCVVWLYGTLVLAERRSGYVIVLLGSLLSLAIPVLHMMGKGVMHGSRVANSSGAFFFIWTLIAVGVTALFSVILCVRGLWSLRRASLSSRG